MDELKPSGLLAIAIGFCIGNAICIPLLGITTAEAVERTWFQTTVLFVVWLCYRKPKGCPRC